MNILYRKMIINGHFYIIYILLFTIKPVLKATCIKQSPRMPYLKFPNVLSKHLSYATTFWHSHRCLLNAGLTVYPELSYNEPSYSIVPEYFYFFTIAPYKELASTVKYWCYDFSMKRYQPWSCWTQIYPAFANSVDPDQLASEEASWSGTALFGTKYMYVNLYKQPRSINLISWKLEMKWVWHLYSAWQGLKNLNSRGHFKGNGYTQGN